MGWWGYDHRRILKRLTCESEEAGHTYILLQNGFECSEDQFILDVTISIWLDMGASSAADFDPPPWKLMQLVFRNALLQVRMNIPATIHYLQGIIHPMGF